MTEEKQNQIQENCPLCEVSPETIEKLKNQNKERESQKIEKKGFWQRLFKKDESKNN